MDFMSNCYQTNDKQLQQFYTTSCGQWCMFFIWHQSLGIDLNEMIDGLGDLSQPLVTDHKMNYWVNKIFGTKENVIDKNYAKLMFEKMEKFSKNEKI